MWSIFRVSERYRVGARACNPNFYVPCVLHGARELLAVRKDELRPTH